MKRFVLIMLLIGALFLTSCSENNKALSTSTPIATPLQTATAKPSAPPSPVKTPELSAKPAVAPSQNLKIDVYHIANLKEPKDFSTFKDKKRIQNQFSTYELLVTDSTNVKLNMKIYNGIKEMIMCSLKKDTLINIKLFICESNNVAEKLYNSELTRHISESSDELNNKWFTSKEVFSANSSYIKVGFQKGNLVIVLEENKNNSDNKTNMNVVITHLAEILKAEF